MGKRSLWGVGGRSLREKGFLASRKGEEREVKLRRHDGSPIIAQCGKSYLIVP